MNCLNCSADVTNGLALCDLCQMAAAKALEFLPIYFRNLARWKPGRSGVRSVPGSREPIVAIGGTDKVSRALDEAGADITGWARALADDRPVELPDLDSEDDTIAALCRLLAEHLVSIATLEWAGAFIYGLTRLEETLRKLTETVAPGWYAGSCHVCTAPTYVIPGLTWVTCRLCGATTYARDHLETILDEARGWVARPKAISQAIVALVDTELSVPRLYTRIRQWAHQGDIVAIRRTERDHVWSDEHERVIVAEVKVGHARYRFGEVLDLTLRRDTIVAAAREVS